jgi:ATP synthase F1 gamma subunit
LAIAIKAAPVEVIVISNTSRTFFLQQPRLLEIPVVIPRENDGINAVLFRLKLQSTIIQFLYDSLLAEQSARFLSMDSATRNAEEVLAQAKIDYNKLRQTLVTRELLELSNSFLPE